MPGRTKRLNRFQERYGPWAVVTGASEGIGQEMALRERHEISVSSYATIRTNCIVPFSVERVRTNIYFCNRRTRSSTAGNKLSKRRFTASISTISSRVSILKKY